MRYVEDAAFHALPGSWKFWEELMFTASGLLVVLAVARAKLLSMSMGCWQAFYFDKLNMLTENFRRVYAAKDAVTENVPIAVISELPQTFIWSNQTKFLPSAQACMQHKGSEHVTALEACLY
jgi:hypothetical protein